MCVRVSKQGINTIDYFKTENLVNFPLQKNIIFKVNIQPYKRLQAEFPLLFLYNVRSAFGCLGEKKGKQYMHHPEGI